MTDAERIADLRAAISNSHVLVTEGLNGINKAKRMFRGGSPESLALSNAAAVFVMIRAELTLRG